MALLAQPPLRVERGRAARAGGGHGLAVDVILDVTGREDAGTFVAVDPGRVTR